MKIALLLSVPLVSASVFAAATVQSSNAIGLLRVDSTQKQTIVCVPWVGSSANATDQKIPVTDIVKTANLTPSGERYDGDELHWYDPSAKSYKSWHLVPGKSGAAPVWEATPTISENGAESGPPAVGTALARGEAFILIRQNPAVPFYLLGQVAKAGSVTSEFLAGAYSLLAPPSAAVDGINVNSATWANVNATDQIMFTDSTGNSRTLSWNPTAEAGGKWGVFKRTFTDPDGTWNYNVLIAPGCGAWYVNKGENKVTATWGAAN